MRCFAPRNNPGAPQIIPNRGAHDQILVNEMEIYSLLLLEAIEYEPEYGPNAKVYRPVGPADTDTILGWLSRGE